MAESARRQVPAAASQEMAAGDARAVKIRLRRLEEQVARREVRARRSGRGLQARERRAQAEQQAVISTLAQWLQAVAHALPRTAQPAQPLPAEHRPTAAEQVAELARARTSVGEKKSDGSRKRSR